MVRVIKAVRQDLAAHSGPDARRCYRRFFREEIRCYGLKTATVASIAGKHWKEIESREKQEILALCEDLYRSGMLEEALIASAWAPQLADRYDPGDIVVFQHWIDAHIACQAACDSLCNHTLGGFILRHPGGIEELKRWTQSENRWMRRAAAVSLIVPAKCGELLTGILAIAGLLLADTDDLVQKGYGWLLREASRRHMSEVFSFVMENREDMPRAAFGYAIELMPDDLKAEAMIHPAAGAVPQRT